MKFFRQGICLAVLGTSLAAFPTLQASAGPDPRSDRPLIQQMTEVASGQVAISTEPATGKVGFVRAARNGDLLPTRAATSAQSAESKATAYLDRFAPAFGARAAQLDPADVTRNAQGWTVSYRQEYQGVPVFGSLLRAHVDAQGDLTGVNGTAVPDLDLSVSPRIDRAAAGERAVRAVRADPPGHDGTKADTSGIRAATTELVVYRMGLVSGEKGGDNILAYRVEVTNERNIRDIVFVSAETGKPVNRYSMIHEAIDRELYEADAQRNLTRVWKEGDPLPGSLNEDQESMVRSTGDAYWFFKNAFGRDSYDGKGATMVTVNNDPAIRCPNANWNGTSTNYCDGVSSDDTVAHEWGHAYTEYTHGLIYQWQPGALNESYSDIWGETVDMLNGRLDTGEQNPESRRQVGVCSTHTAATPVLSITSPASIAKDCLTGGASFGPQLDGDGLSGQVVPAADAADTTGPTTTDGCTPYTNAAAVAGKIALVDRGSCAFTEKTLRAQEAGAIAVVIGNNDDSVISPSGTGDQFTIPTVTIGRTDRELIRTTAAGGTPVQVTMRDTGGNRADSYRWLSGEGDPAFGGAIRDMWNPTCLGDPGKVTDAEYKCSTDDSGGVHSNSGVPNHGYALLVDGGTYNDVTVAGIGLTKAAHIYYRAMTEYQTPTSTFGDHADALAASCTDLTGKPLNELSTKADDAKASSAVITAADCAAVNAMARAVELRTEPVQCNFQPLLAQGELSLCGEGTVTKSVWGDDFEDGLGDWEVSTDNATYTGDQELDWIADQTLPQGRRGAGAVALDPSSGTCDGGADDLSGHTTMTSPVITLPADAKTPRLSFDHYVATEGGFDGGNVKMSVDGGPFRLVPDGAYLFNPPNSTFETAAAGNTNPLAGEAAFTGTDGGVVRGSWGQSVIDLGRAGVKQGAKLQVRFDMGRDGCGGLDGWYVDDVQVEVCVKKVEAALTPTTVKARYAARKVRRSLVIATVTPARAAAGAPTGQVVVTGPRGRFLGKASVVRGKASVRVRALRPGRTWLTVRYSGDDAFKASSTRIKVRVRR